MAVFIKLTSPDTSGSKSVYRLANFTFPALLNLWMLNVNNDIAGVNMGKISRPSSGILMMSNHLSWADIVIFVFYLKDKMPMTKFFLKHELLYVPLSVWPASF
ncbi:1-acyl-sn-glycerol-3-phosphate acyltransferase [Vibrio lentus]|nr:1-acyl-sn-glycerol-3-phosphate acyltransferase [Vibrio lentus]